MERVWNNKGTRIYSNGNRYVGNFVDGEPEGEGIMYFSNGDQYSGEWQRGHYHGKGVLTFNFGDKYEGDFMYGHYHGNGKYTYKDGTFYMGEYLTKSTNKMLMSSIDANFDKEFPVANSLRNGFGVRVFANGNKYEGTWVDDTMEGSCSILRKPDGSKYEGGFKRNVRHGMGIEEFGNKVGMKYICPMGHRHEGEGYCIYNGEFFNGLFHGEGQFVCVDGRKYKGQFFRGKKHGKGYCSYLVDGDIGDPKRLFIGGRDSLYRIKEYDGQWVNDKREGAGIITYITGEKVEGTFVSGLVDGVAIFHFPGGKYRYCRFKNGERIEWLDNSLYEVQKRMKNVLGQFYTYLG